MAVRIQFRRGLSTEWSAANPILAEGELGFESDTKVIKFGDGSTAWNSLPVAAAGDITAVIAGAGLLGGATSGQATLSIDPSYVITAAAIDSPGDLIVGAGPDTYARLPVGPNGSVLVADSNQTVGVRWAAASSGSGAVLPTGTILPFAGTVLPAGGFLWCDGQPHPRSTYSDLYTALGGAASPYGQGNGSTTFNVPDLRSRVPAGYKASDTDFGTLGATPGEARNTLTSAQVPSHNHGVTFTGTDGTHSHSSVVTGNQSQDHNHSVSISGGNHNHTIQFHDIGGSGAGFGTGPIGLDNSGSLQSRVANSSSHSHSTSVGNQSTNHTHTFSITNTGPHSHSATVTNSLSASVSLMNLQPSLVVNYIIKT